MPIVFGVISLALFVIALLQEKNHDGTDTMDHIIIILLFFSTLFFVFTGISMMSVTELYVDGGGTLQIYYPPEYRPLGYAGIILAFIPGLMLTTKVFDLLGRGE